VNVVLASDSVRYDSAAGLFSVNVTVSNLYPMPLGTADGVTVDPGGVRVFFQSGPVSTSGPGAVTVTNADGTGTFTGTEQVYFEYAQIVLTDATSAARTWTFGVPDSVASFSFAVYVEAATPPGTSGVLRVSATNPRYFTDNTGRAVYLTGSHTWLNDQDGGYTDPPPAFDYEAYLDFLQAHHHNFFRLYHWEQAKWDVETALPYFFSPQPYLRVADTVLADTALDGKPKFDLTALDQSYFDRLRLRVMEAGQRGIYVSIMLFNGWSIEDKFNGPTNPWIGHPFNPANNVNGINTDPSNSGTGLMTQTLDIPAVTTLQVAYVEKVIDAVNDLDNVLYEISNESQAGGGTEQWEDSIINLIHAYERGKPKQHPVGMTALSYGDNTSLFASPAEWISPLGYDSLPPAADGSKVIVWDTDHLCCDTLVDESFVWRAMTQGNNPIFMDPYDGTFPDVPPRNPNDPRWEQVRLNMGYSLTYANRMDLLNMVPNGNLASTGYCLAAPGEGEYLVYLPTAGTVTVDLSGTSGSIALTTEWFSPSLGQVVGAGTVQGGAPQSLTAPGTVGPDAVLYVHP